MIGGAGDVSLANDRLISIQPPAHTMSNSNVANGARMWGQCPEIPQVLGCRRVPKRHAGSVVARKLTGSAVTPSSYRGDKLSRLALPSELMEVFVLQHIHIFDDGKEDVKMIGVYS